MQNTYNRKGYLAFSLVLSTAATSLAALIAAQLSNVSFAGSYREVQIQVDPETSDSLSVRVGDGSLGTTIGGVVQKGATLVGGSAADTYRNSGANDVFAKMLYLQAVSGAPIVNVQLWEF